MRTPFRSGSAAEPPPGRRARLEPGAETWSVSADSHPNVLLLADDPAQGAAARVALAREGCSVELRPAGGADADAALRSAVAGGSGAASDAVVIVCTRSDWDYLGLCRRLREAGPVGLPILVVAAHGGEVDRVLAIELGADDFLALPYSPRELGARLRARLRRRRLELSARSTAPAVVGTTRLRVGDLVVDLDQRDAWLRGERLPLRRREFDVLAVLLQNRGCTVTRGRLAQLWDEPPEHGSRTLDMHVRRLREKIEADPSRPEYLHTVRGTGYRLNREPRSDRPDRALNGDPGDNRAALRGRL